MIKLMLKLLNYMPKCLREAYVKCITPYLLRRLNKGIKSLKQEAYLERQAGIHCAYDGALNCGRDQQDWFEQCFNNVAHFFLGGGPTRKHYIQAILAWEDAPKLLLWRTQFYVWVLKTRYLSAQEPTWKYCVMISLYTALITYLLIRN